MKSAHQLCSQPCERAAAYQHVRTSVQHIGHSLLCLSYGCDTSENKALDFGISVLASVGLYGCEAYSLPTVKRALVPMKLPARLYGLFTDIPLHFHSMVNTRDQQVIEARPRLSGRFAL